MAVYNVWEDIIYGWNKENLFQNLTDVHDE